MLAFSNIFVQILFFMGFDIFHTITLQAGCKFSLSKQMLAFSIFLIFDAVSHLSYLHSPNRFKVHSRTSQAGCRLSLSMQTFGVHSPSKCWLSHIYFCSILIFHGVYTITLQAGCKFLLSKQMFALHSPSRCWLFQFFLF